MLILVQEGGYVMEKWKYIEGYEGIYQVSDLGRIRSVDRYVKHSRGEFKKPKKGKVLKQCDTSKSNYTTINLSKNGKTKTYYVHRLVALAFCVKEEGKNYVNHIDGNTRNNNYRNLEWCTAKENSRHMVKNGLFKNKEKETILEKIETGERLEFVNRTEACKFLNRTSSYILQKIRLGKNEFLGYRLIK